MNKKTVLITGATKGIGWSIAKESARVQHNIILTGRNLDLLEVKKNELQELYPNIVVQAFRLDVTNRSDIKKVSASIGNIDILINNAGIISDRTFKKMTYADWDNVLSTNLTGAFNVSRVFLNNITNGGQIIMVTSKSALFGNFGQSNYAASKAGLIGFSRSLSKELKKSNIRVNCIAPAAKTDMTKNALQKIAEHYAHSIPEEWRMGSSKAVASFIVNYMFSDQNTGQLFSVNGDEVGYWSDPVFHKITWRQL